MAVYGNTVAFQEAYSNRIDLISWLNETCTSFNDYIDSFLIIKEENDLIVADVPYKEVEDDKSDEKKKETVEKIKKTFWQKVKEIFIKVIDAIKKFFRGIYTNIYNMYLKVNLKDKFWSRWKDKVTYVNLVKAKDNGWKGLPAKLSLPYKIWDTSDSRLFTDLNREDKYNLWKEYNINNILDLIDKLMDAKEESEIESIYGDIEKIANKQKSLLKYYDRDVIETAVTGGQLKTDEAKIYDDFTASFSLGAPKLKNGETHYFPEKGAFVTTKKLAEEGQSIQKSANYDNKINLKFIKDDKAIQKSLIKNELKEFADDPLMTKKLNYKMKATMQYITLYYQRCYATCKSVGYVVTLQYSSAIQGYMRFIHAINKYVFGNEEKVTAEA